MYTNRLKSLLLSSLLCSQFFATAAAQTTVEHVLQAVIKIETEVPEGARTAGALGTERLGSGVVIDEDLVLTIGYIIMESSSVMVADSDGNMVRGEVVAYHNETGFGLVRAQRPLDIEPIELGDSSTLSSDDPVMVVGYGGAQGLQPASVSSRRVFAGYWEYLLDNAIFTQPPYSRFGGAALVGADGRLLGIGSLVVQDAEADGEMSSPGNMFVPINLLNPILDELVKEGKTSAERRPWLGMFTEMFKGHMFVSRVADDGPAQAAGIQDGDIVLKVGDQPVGGLEDLFRKVWALGAAGVEVPVTILRNAEIMEIRIKSSDRYEWLKLNPDPTPGGGNVA